LSAHLLALCLAVLLPAIVLGGLALRQLISAERAASEARVLAFIKSLSSDLDREMLGYWRLGEALGASPALRSAQLDVFDQRTRQMQGGQAWFVTIDAPDGRQLINTSLPWTSLPSQKNDAAAISGVIATLKPAITGLFYEGIPPKPVVGVRLPIMNVDNKIAFVLTIAIPTEFLSPLIERYLGASRMMISIADADNTIIINSQRSTDQIGSKISQATIDQLKSGIPITRTTLPSGDEVIRAVDRSPTTHWTVTATAWVEELAGVSRKEWWTFATTAAALIAMSSLLAAAFARRIAIPIQRLSRITDTARPEKPPPSGIAEVDRVSAALAHSIDELGASEERLRLALVAAGAGVWDYDFTTKAAIWSPEMMELYGFTGEQRPPSREHLWSFLFDEDRERIREEAHLQIAKGGPFATEFRFKRPDGSTIWVSSRGVVELGSDGRARAARGIDQDVTAAKEAAAQREALLRMTAERLSEQQALYDSAPIGLVLLDSNLRVQRINRVLAKMVGRPIEGVIGQPVMEILPLAKKAIESQLREVLRTGQPVAGFEFSEPATDTEGERRWTTQLYPLKVENTIIGVGIVCEDITEKKRAEVNQAHLAAIVEAATDAVISVSGDARIRSWNPGAERMFGYSAAEALMRPSGFLVPPASEEFPNGVFNAAMGGENVNIETKRRRKDGTDIPVSISASPMRDERGQIIAVSIMFRDISEQRRREEHTRFIMRELSHRSKNLLAVIQAMGRQTARTSRNLEDFHSRFNARIAGLARSHDLLVKQDWRGVPVTELVQGQLAPFIDRTEEQLRFAGPALLLKPEAAQNIGLALHELATNASKHGALSSPKGRIEIHWELAQRDGQRRFRMTWCERGGPAVIPPADRGFGWTVVEVMVGRALDGEAHIEWRPEGLEWHLDAPATCVAAGIGRSWDLDSIN
jgi:PAS domain S-box-containing protein